MQQNISIQGIADVLYNISNEDIADVLDNINIQGIVDVLHRGCFYCIIIIL